MSTSSRLFSTAATILVALALSSETVMHFIGGAIFYRERPSSNFRFSVGIWNHPIPRSQWVDEFFIGHICTRPDLS
jgi:hypothetical protein